MNIERAGKVRQDVTEFSRIPLLTAVAESFLILVLFFLFAGGAPPDANEAHYLAKAKHYWDPSWCRDDFFLNTADAHQVFYWTFGWLTLWLPLPAVAWVGRIVTWGLLAWSWRRLSFALVPRPMFALISAGLFLAFNQRCHMAGEWVVGGFEAKSVAYAFVWFGLAAIVHRQWRLAWLLLGAAAAFHVLVGGWSVIAAAIAWVLQGAQRGPLRTQLTALAGGLLLALPGLLPALALSRNVDREVNAAANEIYVFERLSHHLVPHRFDPAKIAAHLALIAVWLGLAYVLRRDEAQRRLQSFVLGAVIIALAGVFLDASLAFRPDLAAALLRYYWFRLSDVAVPIGVAFAVLAWITRQEASPRSEPQWLTIATILMVTLNMADVLYERRLDDRPGAEIQGLPARSDIEGPTRASIYHDWLSACEWIERHTPADAVFLTPRRQQSFVWHANRGEVYCWKNVPQDAKGLLAWEARGQRIFPAQPPADPGADYDLLQQSDEELAALCLDYHARYIVIDRTRLSRTGALPRRPRFARVFPEPWNDVRAYEVYDISQPLESPP